MSHEGHGDEAESVDEKEEERYLNTFLKVKYKKVDKKNIKATTALQKIFRCRNQENSQYYFTIGRKETVNIRDVLKEKTPYGHPPILKEESFKAYSKSKNEEIRKQELNLRYYERDTVKSRQMRDLRARVYVEQPVDDVHTVVDLDPEFFSLIEGRPIEYPFDKTVYNNDVRECMLFKLQAGYREDEVLRIEENFMDEEAKYKEICNRYNEYVDSFEQFLSEDYKKAIAMLRSSDELSNTLQKKKEEFKQLSINLGIKRRKVYVLEEKCRHTKMYQDFLYTVSPRAWREENGILKNKNLLQEDSLKELPGTSDGMFAKYQLQSQDGTIPSLMNLINRFRDDQENAQEPLLYFTDPQQITKIFRYITMQNLNSWTHAENLSDSLAKLNEGMTKVKLIIQQEEREIEEIIDELRQEIEYEEQKVESLKVKVNKIINTHFYDAVSSEYATKLYLCVKDVYEKLILSTVSFSTFEMMKTLQTEYESIMLQLDGLDPVCVNEIRKETFVKDRIAMKLAHEAAVQLKNLEKVNKSLRHDLEPPFKRVGKQIMYRTYWPPLKKTDK